MSRLEQASDKANDARPGWHLWLLVLLALVLGPRAIDDAIGSSAASALTNIPGRAWFPYLTGLAQILALLTAGIAVDRSGMRRTIALSLIAWGIVLVATAAAAATPSTLYLTHVAAVIAGSFFGLAIPVSAKLAFALSQRARVLALLNTVAMAWLLLLPFYLSSANWPPKPPSQPGWAIGCLAASGLAAILVALWWLTLRPRAARDLAPVKQPHDEWSLAEIGALLRRPGMWALAIVMTCHMQVFAMLYYVLAIYMVGERFMPPETFKQAVAVPILVSVVAQIALAFWSDLRARTTGRPATARVPFIVAGATLSTTIGLLPFAGRGAFGAIYWALALGMAMFPLAFTLAFDIVPRALAGRFLGVASALSVAANATLFLVAGIVSTVTHSLASYFYLAALASLIAAATSVFKLWKIEPIEDGLNPIDTIGKVFA